MTSLKHKLRQIEEILQVYPNAFVRVKFDGDDNYRKYPSNGVINDTFSDTCRFQNALISMLYRVAATLKRHFRQKVSVEMTLRQRNPRLEPPLGGSSGCG